MSEEYRQSLRKELRNRKFAHKHYSQEQINEARNLRRRQLESSIAEHKEEIKELKPKHNIVDGILSRVFKGKKK